MRAELFARREERVPAPVGFYRVAVIHHSPGLQPWVNRAKRHALKVASEVLGLALSVDSVDGAGCWHDRWNQHVNLLNITLGRHFQGASSKSRNPGLKPWAVLFIPFGENRPVGTLVVVAHDSAKLNTPTLRSHGSEDEDENDSKHP